MLRPEEIDLLREVVQRHLSSRSDLVAGAERGTLSPAERQELCHAIGLEFTASGLDDNDEPTPRGLRLEALLDKFNRPAVQPRN